jgi:UDP-N-acetyl-D-glucosamine dehydrogenase
MGAITTPGARERILLRIADREARVVVMGAGYVGLPLAVEFAGAGFATTAVDTDAPRVRAIAEGRSYVGDVSDRTLGRLVRSGKLAATTDVDVLRSCDAVVICVPTPLNKTKDPDVAFIVSVLDALAPRLRMGQLVVLESTTYPGFTREALLPRLEEGGLRAGEDFFVAFSPERVDPGNRTWGIRNTPKVLGGVTPACREVAAALYGKIVERLVPVSSTDAAEMAKLLENTFRAVNIGLVNEVAIMCHRLGLDTWEVIEAAATKPFGYMPFYPGPGLGGHCIPVDPHYLSWKLKTLRYNARFIELAAEINSWMPEFVVHRVVDLLNERRKPLSGSRVLVLGVSYKRDVHDVRESPALDIVELLQARGAEVAYHDPHVPELAQGGLKMRSVPLDKLDAYDCVLIATDHSAVDYRRVVAEAPLVLDTRNATRGLRAGAEGRVYGL